MIKSQPTITPEALLPITFRHQEVAEVLQLLDTNQSITLVGMKRVGLSYFLRFVTYHPALRKSDSKPQIFVYLDSNDLVEISLRQFWLLLLKRLYDIRYALAEDQQQAIIEIYTKLLENNPPEELFLLEGVKEIARIFAGSDIRLVVILARFDRLLPVFSEQFFANLQSLVDMASHHITYVFTSYLPFQQLCPQIFFSGSFSMFAKPYYLKPANPQDCDLIVSLFEQQRGIQLKPALKNAIITVTGGHIQLLQLCLLVASEQLVSPNTDLGTLSVTLASDERVLLQCDELFESLTQQEQSYLLKQSKKKPTEYLVNTGMIDAEGTVFSRLFAYYLERKRTENTIPFRSYSQLTKKESLLLAYFFDHKDSVCTRDDIISAVWPEFEDISDWALDQLVSRLRRKLETLKTGMEIKTNRGKGYELIEKT